MLEIVDLLTRDSLCLVLSLIVSSLNHVTQEEQTPSHFSVCFVRWKIPLSLKTAFDVCIKALFFFFFWRQNIFLETQPGAFVRVDFVLFFFLSVISPSLALALSLSLRCEVSISISSCVPWSKTIFCNLSVFYQAYLRVENGRAWRWRRAWELIKFQSSTVMNVK